MVNYPARGTPEWDDDLKQYIDGHHRNVQNSAVASAAAAEAARAAAVTAKNQTAAGAAAAAASASQANEALRLATAITGARSGIVNPGAILPWRSALASPGVASLAIIGDSITEGGVVGSFNDTYPVLLQNQLREAVGHTGGIGYVPAVKTTDAVVPSLPNVSVGTPVMWLYALGGRAIYLSTSADHVTYNPQPCTRVKVYYGKTTVAGGGLRVLIDGVDQGMTLLSQGTQTSGGHVWTSPPLSAGNHTVKIIPSNTPFVGVLEGVEFLQGDENSGVRVYNAGHYGGSAHQFASDQMLPSWQSVVAVEPDLVMIALGGNDLLTSNPTTFLTSIDTMISRVPANVPVLLLGYYLLGMYGADPAKIAAWRQMQEGLEQRAVGRVAYLDIAPHWPKLLPDGSTNGGLMFEATNASHPNTAGMKKIADILAAALGHVTDNSFVGPKGDPGGWTLSYVADGVHLDTLTTPGLYARSTTVGSAPTEGYPVTLFAGYIDVRGAGVYTKQTAHYLSSPGGTGAALYNGAIWERSRSSAAWSPWTRVDTGYHESKADPHSQYKLRADPIFTGGDVNTLVTGGTYLVAGAAATPANNFPPLNGSGVFVTVQRQAGSGNTRQVIEAFTSSGPNNLRYSRTSSDGGATWSAWIDSLSAHRVEADPHPQYLTKTPAVATGTDLNSMATPGTYWVTSAIAGGANSNAPVNVGGWLEVVMQPSYGALQRYYVASSANQEFYFRQRFGATNWSAWQKVNTGPAGTPSTLSGVGFPTMAAPVGTRYIDTAATNGAVEWIKASGTGATGWQVSYGDTGWREITSLIDERWDNTLINSTRFARIRRVGDLVHVSVALRRVGLLGGGRGDANSGFVLAFPAGMNPFVGGGYSAYPMEVAGQPIVRSPPSAANLSLYGATGPWADGDIARTQFAFTTTQAWPAVLPGTPA